MLDGDNLRNGLNADLGYSPADRSENVRRIGEVARLLADAGLVALVPVISPYRANRGPGTRRPRRRRTARSSRCSSTPRWRCVRQRDPKGLYARARAGELTGLTGVDDPYEPPTSPDVHVTAADLDRAVTAVIAAL